MNIRKIAYFGAILAGGAFATTLVLGASALKKEGDYLRKAAENGAFLTNSRSPDAALPMPEPELMPTSALRSEADTTGRVLAHCPPKATLCDLATQTKRLAR